MKWEDLINQVFDSISDPTLTIIIIDFYGLISKELETLRTGVHNNPFGIIKLMEARALLDIIEENIKDVTGIRLQADSLSLGEYIEYLEDLKR